MRQALNRLSLQLQEVVLGGIYIDRRYTAGLIYEEGQRVTPARGNNEHVIIGCDAKGLPHRFRVLPTLTVGHRERNNGRRAEPHHILLPFV